MTKEIIVLSGKGGAGKTTYAASLSYLAQHEAVIADCDVDASDMHLLLQPVIKRQEDFFSGQTAVIDPDKCIQCGDCESVCRFNAISQSVSSFQVNPIKCEGCGYCPRICPATAITMLDTKNGELYISENRFESPMVHAAMEVGGENSGKLVAKVKQEAKILAMNKQKPYVIIDGSPGIGCPVTAGLSGAQLAVVVAEPTVSGIHDVVRLVELIEKMNIQAVAVINKSTINLDKTLELREFFAEKHIDLIQEIPYDMQFVEAISAGKTPAEFVNGQIRKDFQNSWQTIKHKLES